MADPDSLVTLRLSRQSEQYIAELASRLGNPQGVKTIMVSLLSREAQIIAGQSAEDAFGPGKKLKVRTGNLRRAMVGTARLGGGGNVEIVIGILRGPADVYSGPQELGTKRYNPSSPYATIVPRRGRYLAVPTDDGGALTPAGVNRYQSARQFPEPLTFVRGRFRAKVNGKELRAGAALVRNTRGRGPRTVTYKRGSRTISYVRGAGNIVYLLLKSVDIRPKFYLRDGMRKHLPAALDRFGETLARFLGTGQQAPAVTQP